MPFSPTPNPPPAAAIDSVGQKHVSGFEPLQSPLFRNLWIASTISNLGGWMQDTAGTWLMTVLTPSPLLIALMQTAASLPVVLLGLLAGATADIFDRRRLLLFWQAWMLAAVALLSRSFNRGYALPGMAAEPAASAILLSLIFSPWLRISRRQSATITA